MADEEAEGQAEKGGGLSKVLLIGILVAVVAAGGGGFFLWKQSQVEPVEEATTEEPAEQQKLAAEERAERLVALEPLVVNLGGSGGPRYLKIQLELEVADVDSKGAVEVSVPMVRDALIVLLGSQRLVDLQQFEGKVLLKEEILDRVNGALGDPLVASVFFTEFIIQ